jgi:hypothetical protein
MAFGIPGITSPSEPIQGGLIDQLSPLGPSLATPPSMAPDSVKKSEPPSSGIYSADILQRAGAEAHTIAASTTAASMGAAERLGPALGQLGAKVVPAAAGVAGAAAPIAGEALGAAGLVLFTPSPAGESEADLAKTRKLDAAGRQHMASTAHSTETEPRHTTFPGQGVDIGPNHTAYPAHVRGAKDGILTTPAETQAKPAHTGHAAPDLRELTKPTGTTIYQPQAADQATLAKQEKIVRPEHAAHLTPSGTLVNADRAVLPTEKLTQYALDPDHPRGGDKARVFKSALGYDQSNYGDLDKQIREGIQREHAEPRGSNEYGSQFSVDIPVAGPAGSAIVRTGWIYDHGSDVPRFTTAFVKK